MVVMEAFKLIAYCFGSFCCDKGYVSDSHRISATFLICTMFMLNKLTVFVCDPWLQGEVNLPEVGVSPKEFIVRDLSP